MSESGEIKERPLEPHKEPSTVEIDQRKGHLSKISGGGVGTFIVWLSDRLHFTEDQRLLAATAATWVAVAIAWAGPSLADEVLRFGKYIRAKYFLKQLDELAKSDPTDTVIAAKAREVRQTIADLLADGAKKFNKIRPGGKS